MCLEARLLATMETKATPLTGFWHHSFEHREQMTLLWGELSTQGAGLVDGAFEPMRPLPYLAWTMVCQSKKVNEHAVIALLDILSQWRATSNLRSLLLPNTKGVMRTGLLHCPH